MDKFELDQKVNGESIAKFMANLLEKNESQELEIERGKLAVDVLKQMNNRSRLLLDAEKFRTQQAVEQAQC